ncbi:magnesium transporter [Paenibacillus sp. 1011MAR3C5]|uniref:magnesium transporter n=1 Tax=Paenibacillus sp. 1011MAR3C5 TaxID=1675787 RepID=UPI000E6BA8AE|nr:magnesium transporter [Paenibacillus sp. 1011MAR3C5]RJE87788.1 magnesium transporter [Paenibacillus sp. 1011MAR3C5]
MIMNLSDTELDLLVQNAIKEGDRAKVQSVAEELQPYDMAAVYGRLPDKFRAGFVIYMTIEQLTAMVGEMEQGQQVEVFALLGVERTAELMDRMDNDDLAVLLGGLSEERKKSFLDYMKKEEVIAVQHLMAYAPETAGRIMTNRYVWIPSHYNVRDTVDKLKDFAEIAESINYLYVVDEKKKLIGVVSYRDLILAEIGDQITDIMYERVIAVPVDMDQEEVARRIERYNFLAIPVVEEDGVLVGIVTVDDIIDVVIREASEDIAKMSASGKSIDFDTKAHVAAYRRLPWLILLLLIGILSGTIISRFEETLDKVVALAFFMPMIAGMTGNTGTQSLAVVVRGLTTKEVTSGVVRRLVWRELMVGLMIGGICGVLISIIAYIWQGSPILGLVVGASLVMTLIIGTLAGTVIPLMLYKLKVDPAVASGPLITTLNDILSLLIYFGIATAFLEYLI